MHLIKVFNKVLAPKIRNSEEIRENVSRTLGQKTKQNIIFPSAALYANGLKTLKKITHKSNKQHGVFDLDQTKNEVKDEVLPLLRPEDEQAVTSTNKKENRNDFDDNDDTASDSSESHESHLSLLIDDVEGHVQISFDPDHVSDACPGISGHDTTVVNDTDPNFDDSFETDDMSESDPMSQDYFLTHHSLYNERPSEKMPSEIDSATASRTTEDLIPCLSRSFEAPSLLVEDDDMYENDVSASPYESESTFDEALSFFEDWNFHADDDSDASSCSSSEDEDCLRAQAFRISRDIERVAIMPSAEDDDDASQFSNTSFSRASLQAIPEEGSWQLDDEEPPPKIPNQTSDPEFNCEKIEGTSPSTETIETANLEDSHDDEEQMSEQLHGTDGIDQPTVLVDSSFEDDTNTFIDEIYEDYHEDDVPPSPVSVKYFDENGVTENDGQTRPSGESGILGKHTEHHVIMKETNVMMKETTLFLEYEQRTTFEHNIASISQGKIQELDVSDRFFLKFFGLNEMPPTGIPEQFHRTAANVSLE